MPDLTEAHRLAQARLGAQTVVAMRSIWPLLNRVELDATTPDWLRSALAVIAAQRAASARLASSYLVAYKAQQLGTTITPELADVVDTRAAMTSLVVTGPVALKRSASRGVPFALALDNAFASSAAAAMRHALNGGRQTIVRSVAADPHAAGWRRVVSGSACQFCRKTAGGGIVRTEAAANFEAHDGCSCGAEPVWAP